MVAVYEMLGFVSYGIISYVEVMCSRFSCFESLMSGLTRGSMWFSEGCLWCQE